MKTIKVTPEKFAKLSAMSESQMLNVLSNYNVPRHRLDRIEWRIDRIAIIDRAIQRTGGRVVDYSHEFVVAEKEEMPLLRDFPYCEVYAEWA